MNIFLNRERLIHYLTAALVPVAAFAFEELIKWPSTWMLIAALLVLYVIAFLLILAIDEIVNIVYEHIPIRLPDVGRIDGWWIDLIYGHSGEILGGATIHIQKSGHGFSIWGRIYGLDDKRTRLRLLGHFDGKGFVWMGSTLGYCFDGKVQDEPDSGSGHIVFKVPKPTAKDATEMEGSFIGIRNVGIRNGKPGHRFVGTKVLGNTEEAALQLLLGRLQTEMKKGNARDKGGPGKPQSNAS